MKISRAVKPQPLKRHLQFSQKIFGFFSKIFKLTLFFELLQIFIEKLSFESYCELVKLFSLSQFKLVQKIIRRAMLRGQTVNWIGAQFGVCMFLDSRDKSLNMFQNVSGFYLQNSCGLCVQKRLT